MDAFLRDYFDRHAFHSMTTTAFMEELREKLLAQHPGAEDQIGVEQWVHTPGIPVNVPQVHSDAFTKVEAQVKAFESGNQASQLMTQNWSTHEWIHFLRHLPKTLNYGQLIDLDEAFHFTDSGNSEILHEWRCRHRAQYAPAYDSLERFLSARAAASSSSPLPNSPNPEGWIARSFPRNRADTRGDLGLLSDLTRRVTFEGLKSQVAGLKRPCRLLATLRLIFATPPPRRNLPSTNAIGRGPWRRRNQVPAESLLSAETGGFIIRWFRG